MEQKIWVHDRLFEVMIPAEDISKCVERVASQLNDKYSAEDNILILGVLNGAFIFLSDLVRLLNFPVEISFVKLSSYDGLCSSGEVKELIGLNTPLEGRKVIIVEDIVDTGKSITELIERVESGGASEVSVCTLFFKPNAYKGEREIEYAAMEIGNEFIVGYGLDYNELGRELKDIYVTKDE